MHPHSPTQSTRDSAHYLNPPAAGNPYGGLFESVLARMILDARVAEEFKATTIIAVIVALVCAKR